MLNDGDFPLASSGPQTSGSILDTECHSDVILTIAQLSFDWRRVGQHLIGNHCITDIQREEYDDQKRKERMLLTWLEQEGSKATYRHLVEVLRELRYHAIADEVIKIEMEG